MCEIGDFPRISYEYFEAFSDLEKSEIIVMNYGILVRRSFGNDAKQRFLRKLESVPPTKHPRLISDSDQNSVMSVLVPLVTVNNVPSVLLTKRSSNLRSHRGEVCFPGGRKDADETSQQTALRETFEEIGIEPDNVEIWSGLKSVVRRQRDFVVTPIVGHIKENSLKTLKINEQEVQAVITVPLNEICQVAGYTRFKNAKNGVKYMLPVFDSTKFMVHYNAQNQYLHSTQRIWGLSAVILHQAMCILNPDDNYNHDIVIKFF